MRFPVLLLPLMVGAGCTSPDDVQLPPDESELGPAPSADELAQVRDGTAGWARIKSPEGEQVLPYIAHNGHAIYEGDMDLGPIAKVDARLRGGAVSGTADRWTNNSVDFAFHTDFTGSARQVVRDALAELQAVVPITFHEIPYGTHTGGWVEFKWAGSNSDFGGMSTSVGMMGCGEIHCSSVEGTCRSDCGQWIYFKGYSAPSKTTVKHEMLHALGFFHEQSRNDRDTFINVNSECIASNSSQFSMRNESLDLGPYDFKSIMHYSSWAYCKEDPAHDGDNYYRGCECLPMTKTVDLNGNGLLDSFGPSSDLTVEDINSMYRAYARVIGANDDGDKFGASMATADFDGDGYADAAIGAPGNNNGAGAVFIFKGTSARLVPWKAFTQSAFNGDVVAGDAFGTALAAADINGDGMADLVIGAPGEDVGAATDAGQVHLLMGSKTGLVFRRNYVQADLGGTSDTGDRFGAAVAIGAFMGAAASRQIAVGAPGDISSTRVGSAHTGAVYAFADDTEMLFPAKATRITTAAVNAQFGAALAVKTGGQADLAVGAPGAAGVGAVYVYNGRTPPEVDSTQWSAMLQYGAGITNPNGSLADQFGAAVALDSEELSVGAPGYSNKNGRVYWYQWTGDSLIARDKITGTSAQELGAAFSYAARLSDKMLLAVGSPGYNSGAGKVEVWDWSVIGQAHWLRKTLVQTSVVSQLAESGDRFGSAIAPLIRPDGSGSTDMQVKRNDILVGAPGEKVNLLANSGPAAGSVGQLFDVDINVDAGSPIGIGFDQGTAIRN